MLDPKRPFMLGQPMSKPVTKFETPSDAPKPGKQQKKLKLPAGLADLNLPNLLTVARILAIPVIVVLAISNVDLFRWLALLVFVAAAITDFFDGALARMLNQTSELGKMLDPIADKLLVAALLLAFCWDRTFSVFDLIPATAILMREVFVSGMREFLGGKNVSVPVSRLAKYKTTLQLIALAILLAEPMMPGLRLFSDLVLWSAAALTVWTGWSYWKGMAVHLKDAVK